MELAKGESKTFSVLMFPWLAHGHLFPYIELAKNLSKKNFKIFFCSTTTNLASVKDYLEKSPSSNGDVLSKIQSMELRLPSFPDLPPQYHTTKNAPPHLLHRLYQAFHMSKSSFWEIISTLKPDLLIYDIYQTWAAEQASSLNIPAVHFSIAGATTFAFSYHYSMHKDVLFPYEAIYVRDYEIKASEAAMADSDSYREDLDESGFNPFRLSHKIVLMKSFSGIEGKYADYLSHLIQKKVVPVGTLVVHDQVTSTEHDHIFEWLSKKTNSSTVFISFGSENYLSKDQIEEMAKGIELCDGVNFVWPVRFPAGEEAISLEEVLPAGFREKVKERVMILEGWAPQAKILGHPSIGAFLSHCGLSGILESLYFGVPIVALPLKLDQPFNARLLVECGVGVEVARDDNGHICREEFAKAVNAVVLEKFGEDMRLKAAELSEKIRSEEEQVVAGAAEQLRQLCMESQKQNSSMSL